jgi:deazaflavin-dependent oxidoreductase (nitroreductase family)
MRWQKLYNPIVSWLLHSPLHGLIGGSTMLITFTGHKSGKIYTTPVNYVWDDHTLLVVSLKDRLWWRNLRVSAPVTVCVRGQTFRGVGRAFESEEAVDEGGLLSMLRKAPPTGGTGRWSWMRRVNLRIHKTSCGSPGPTH